jgi:hypothetical protein
MSYICHKCKCELDLCPSDGPLEMELWICPECEFVYFAEELIEDEE